MSPHLSSATFALLAKTSGTTTSSSGDSTILFVIVIIAAGYFLLVRPQRRRARNASQLQESIEIGDEVLLTSGIIGHVTWLEGDRARLEISPNTEIEVLRAAIGRKVTPPVTDDEIAVRDEDDAHYGDNPYVEPAGAAHEAVDEDAHAADGDEAAESDGDDKEGS